MINYISGRYDHNEKSIIVITHILLEVKHVDTIMITQIVYVPEVKRHGLNFLLFDIKTNLCVEDEGQKLDNQSI